MSATTAIRSPADSIEKNQAQQPVDNQQVATKKQSSIYQIAATRLAKNAQTIMVTAFVLTAIANIPGASAGPCEVTEKICVATCMSMGGPMPTETGACLAGCKLAYWACKAGAAYMGWPG